MNNSLIRNLFLGSLMSLSLAASAASDRTVSVEEKVDLQATPAQSWNMVKDFMGWQQWHPAFASTQLVSGTPNASGAIRLLTTKDGAKFTEELVSHSAETYTYQYRIIESPAPVLNYVSTLRVIKQGTGSTVVWNSSFKVKEGTPEADAKKAIAGIYRLGLDNLVVLQNDANGGRRGK
jgi:hypothetical protein